MLPQPDIWDLRADLVGIACGSLLVLMSEVPHTLHTLSRSSLYIYNAIQHILHWLQVIIIRMHLQPDICPLGLASRSCWYSSSRWVSVSSYD
jgi:hypothetical protein